MRSIMLVLVLAGLLAWPNAAKAKTITVSTAGDGDFKTVQDAIAAAPDNSDERTIIHLKAGTYEGQIVVPATKRNITFEGDGTDKAFITFDYNTNEPNPPGVDRLYRGTGVVVLADGFIAHDLTFKNVSGDHGQALALRIDGDRAVIHHCRLSGWQDTLMVNNGRHYFRDDYIEGRVDFIYGSATAVFERCEIHSKNGGHVTAASTPADHEFGLVFLDCRLTGDAIPWDPATTNPATTQKVKVTPVGDLGRPWRPYAMVAFLRCEIGDHITPAGWNNWRNPANEATARYSEYQCTGPGAATARRVKWSHQLTDEQATRFTLANILGGKDGWNPLSVLPHEEAGKPVDKN